MLPCAHLLASAAGIAQEHWLRTKIGISLQHLQTLSRSEPKIGQALCSAWIVSIVSIALLMLRIVVGTARIGIEFLYSQVSVARGNVRNRTFESCPGRVGTIEE